MKRKHKINNIVVISDTHAGCSFGLCVPLVTLDSGGEYRASRLQLAVYKAWQEWWGEWVPLFTRGEPWILVMNGDAIDGRHHRATTQISQNLTDQKNIAKMLLSPIISDKNCAGYYHIRGTEAHVGPSGEDEEELAKSLGAIPDENGNSARWQLWMRLDRALIHFSHHIGTTASSAYESTAVYKEMVEAMNEAGRWGDEPPDVIVRSHRHRQFETTVATEKGMGKSIVTPGWQLSTPFVHRLASGRAGTPHVGGYVIRTGDQDEVYSRFKVWKIKRPKEVVI